MNANVNEAVFDSLLDRSLDDLADMPAFKVFPAGGHLCTLQWSQKMINDKPSIIAKLIYKSAVELADPTATPPEPGTECDVAFILRNNDGGVNEFGEGKWKDILKQLAPKVGGTSPRDIMEKSNNAEVMVVTKVRVNKDTKAENLDIVAIDIA